MGIFESIKNSIKNSFDKRKEEQEMMDKLRNEARREEMLHFEKAYRQNMLEVAKAKAYRDAAKLSGLQKLRAMNRARNLNESSPGSIFSKLRDYTQKNMARREENLKRTEEMRMVAKQMQEERLMKRQMERESKIINRRPGGNFYG